MMTSGEIIKFPFPNDKAAPVIQENTQGLANWSMRRIALEILTRDEMMLQATCAVAGAFAAKSIELSDYGMWIVLDSNTKAPIELVRDLAHELTEDKDPRLDNNTSFFSALGCFAYEFILVKCSVGGAEDVSS